MARGKYIVKRVLPLESLNLITNDDNFMEIQGVRFHYDYEKVKTFQRSCTCINCGLEATELRLERMKACAHPIYGTEHLNMYGYTHKGHEVMFTVDHAVLKSKGGPDCTENYNTMCSRCNFRRGAKYENLQDFLNLHKDTSTEQYWDDVEKFDEEKAQRQRERNLEKKKGKKQSIEEFLANSMHHHVGLYNRHMKKLKKELTSEA